MHISQIESIFVAERAEAALPVSPRMIANYPLHPLDLKTAQGLCEIDRHQEPSGSADLTNKMLSKIARSRAILTSRALNMLLWNESAFSGYHSAELASDQSSIVMRDQQLGQYLPLWNFSAASAPSSNVKITTAHME